MSGHNIIPIGVSAPAMPKSAMERVRVDYCLPLSDIAPLLSTLASDAANEDRPASSDMETETALKTMRHEKIRRLPVVNRDGMLQGILTLNDITLRAEDDEGRRHPELTDDRAMGTFKAICEHRPARRAAAA